MAADNEDLKAMDAAIDRMRTFIRADPYVLTIPQDVEPRYRHTYAFQQRQWLENTPFSRDEHEDMQYQTFVFHEPGKSMYMLQNSQSAGSNETKKPATGANTPSTAPKKKITLDAYKKKQSGATPDARQVKGNEQPARKPAAKAPVKGPVERIKVDEEMLASMGNDPEEPPPAASEKKDLKRKRQGEDSVVENGEPQKKHKQEASEKKEDIAAVKDEKQPNPKQEPNAEECKQPAPAMKTPTKGVSPLVQAQAHEDITSLPPKLSPPRLPKEEKESSLPPKLSPITKPSFPTRLSPTLPDNIAKTLKAREHYRSTSRSSDISVSAVARSLTPPREGKNSTVKKSPINGFRANSSSPAVHSDAGERVSLLASAPAKRKAHDSGAESLDEIAVTTKKPKLLVRLKMKKSLRERWRELLRTPPKPFKVDVSEPPIDRSVRQPSVSDARHREQRDTSAKGVAQKLGPKKRVNGETIKTEASERERKRTLTEDSESDEPPPKKRKPPSESPELKRARAPSTPDKAIISSPSAANKTTTTPGNMRKDLLSVSMKREQSTDSIMNTPSVSHSSPPDATSVTAHGPNGTSKPPTSRQPSTKTPKQAAYEAEQKRLETLGRELKHAATAHLQNLPDSKTSRTTLSQSQKQDQKLAAIKSVESLLSYIFAFHAGDESNLTADPRLPPTVRIWRTLQNFYGFVRRNCDAYPLLLGLVCQLGVVFNARILDLAAQTRNDGPSRETLLDTSAMMMRAAADGERLLGPEKVRQSFPKAWEGQKKGGFDLPIGLHTPALRAARAGWAVLDEWAKKEGVGYDLKLRSEGAGSVGGK